MTQSPLKITPSHSIGSRLFISVLGSALLGIGSMAFLFFQILENQAEGDIQHNLQGKVVSIQQKLTDIEQMGDTLSISISTLKEQGIEGQKIYDDLIFKSYLNRPPLTMAVGFGQTPYGILKDKKWYWGYFYKDQKVTDQIGNILPSPYQDTRFADLFKDDNYPEKGYYLPMIDNPRKMWLEPYQWYKITMTTYLSPIFNQHNQLLGMVGLDINVTDIRKNLEKTITKNGGSITVLSPNGTILIYTKDSEKAKSLKSYKDVPQLKKVWSIIQEKNLDQGFFEEGGFYWAYQKIEGTNWIVLLDVPHSVVVKPILLITVGSALTASLILALVVIGFIHSLNRRLQPILIECQQVILSDATKENILTNFQGDELGILSYYFYEMTDQLKQNVEELETRVIERTTELSIALQQLQQSQLQIVQSEKMSSLGQLVAGIAHEINNPINFIHGNVSHLQQYIQDLLTAIDCYHYHFPTISPELQEELEILELDFLREDVIKILKSMKIGTDRIKEIVKSLRNFSRLDESELKSVNIHEGIESTLMILHHRLKEKSDFPPIKISKYYDDLPLIECYPGQLNQVFMNLLSNAIDAIEESFTLPEKAGAGHLEIITHKLGNNWISIHIRDSGLGIPENIRSKLFDPFFTTKPIGKGTGLGLSISYQIITERHGGNLFCQSSPEGGAEFIIELPMKAIGANTTPSS